MKKSTAVFISLALLAPASAEAGTWRQAPVTAGHAFERSINSDRQAFVGEVIRINGKRRTATVVMDSKCSAWFYYRQHAIRVSDCFGTFRLRTRSRARIVFTWKPIPR